MTHLKPSFPSCPDVLSCADVLAVFQAELARAVPTPGLPPAGPQLWPRFTGYYERLARLPRRARRALQRKWRRPLGAIALLLALGQAPALAATINVDGTSCTLVDAITAANNDGFAGGCAAGSGADTIVLPSNSIHTLTAVDNTTYVFGPTGLPIITSAITIQGNGSTIKREGSAPPFRILVVRFNGNLFLQETTVSGGVGVARGGGGLLNEGNLTLRNCVVSGNSGGGLANFRYGTLTLSNSTVSGNSAGRGGGLNNTATLFVEASVVSGNSAGEGGGLDNDGTLTLTDSTVSGNSAFDGGGVFNDESGTLTLTRSAVSGNSATHPS